MKTLIKGGRILDPAQNLDKIANLLIEDGKIVCVTDEDVPADRVIDASGRMVTPGFIDIHMHEDPYDEKTGEMKQDISKSMLLMGVTTAIGGNCGDNYADPRAYLDHIDECGNCMNLGLLVGHLVRVAEILDLQPVHRRLQAHHLDPVGMHPQGHRQQDHLRHEGEQDDGQAVVPGHAVGQPHQPAQRLANYLHTATTLSVKNQRSSRLSLSSLVTSSRPTALLIFFFAFLQ